MMSLERTYQDYGHPLWRRWLVNRESAIIVLLIAVLAYASLAVPKFATPATLTYLLLDVATILMIALAMTPIMITGDIDLSVGSMVGLSSVVFGVLFQAGWSIPVAIVAALVVGALGGALNGLLVTRIGLPALAVTIGTMALFRGIAVGLLGTTAVTGFPQERTKLARAKIGDSPIPVIMILFVVLLMGAVWMLHFSKFGRGIFALGGDESSAVRAGFKVRRIKFWLYVIVGVIAALGGLVRTTSMGQMHPTNLLGMEMMVIAAVVLGGTAITGGTGSLTGVMLGTLLIVIVQNSMILVGVPTFWQRFALGLLIIVGTGVSAVQLTRRRKRQRLVAE